MVALLTARPPGLPHGVIAGSLPRWDRRRSKAARSTTAEISKILRRRLPSQSAFNDATDGDMVLVAPGTYVENVNFGGKAITVTSESGPEVTIIDGSNAD